MKIIESLRNFFTKKNIKELCKKIWGKEPEPVDESVFDDPDRYVKFDEWKDKQYWEDKKRYKKEKRLLTLRRFCLSVILIFLLTGLIKSVNLFVKTNAFLSCVGRDVCIYLGPKRVYSNFMANKVIGLKNGDALILTYTGDNNYAEYYSKKYNRLSKINSKRNIKINEYITRFGEHQRFFQSKPTALIKNSNDDVLIIDEKSPLEIFDVKNKKFIPTDVNIFNYTDNKTPYDYITHYKNQYSLIRTNNTRPKYLYSPRDGFRTKLTKPEKLYLFNSDDYTLTEMPPLELELKYYPRPSDIIILNNGKIIMPIRYKYKRFDPNEIGFNYYSNNSKPATDHIEIYDPAQNRFIAETNKDILKDNIFHIVQPNNDVIFLNKNSTYLFINKDNKFIKANEELTRRNQQTVEKLAKLMFEHMGVDIEEIFGADRARVVKLAPQKFLITCNIGHMFAFDNTGDPNNAIVPLNKSNLRGYEIVQSCRNTVYFDYKNNIVKKGPKFLQQHFSAAIEQLTDGLFIVVEGHDGYTLPPAKPNARVQFIKVKN